MGRILEGFWDCKHCNSTQIRGGVRQCPNCGTPRDKDTIFYLNKNSTYVSEKKAAYINRNPDWLCKYCQSLNSDDKNVCIYCGAPRTEENLNYFENSQQKYSSDPQENLGYVEEKTEDVSDYLCFSDIYFDNSNNTQTSSFSLTSFISSYFPIILIVLFIILGIWAFVSLFLPKVEAIKITQMSWERSINIERYQSVEESDWSLPPNARLLYCQDEFSHYVPVLHHYETVTVEVPYERIVGTEEYVVGYEDLGNGYFEEITDIRYIYETYYVTETYEEPIYYDQPVYQTKYYYEIDKWLYERSVTTSGNDKSPYWGDYTLASDERVYSKSEHYFITGLVKKENERFLELSYEDWNSLKVGQIVKFKSFLGYGEIVE